MCSPTALTAWVDRLCAARPPAVPVVLLGAWAASLLGLCCHAGFGALLVAVLFGATPAVLLVAAHAEQLGRSVGLVPKRALEEARQAGRAEAASTAPSHEDEETIRWVNFLLEVLWPHFAKYMEDFIVSFEEMIQESIPVPGGLKFRTCSLGSRPCEFGPIRPRLVSGYSGDEFVEACGLELEIGVNWRAETDIVLASKLGYTIGIEGIALSGVLSVFLRPLMGKVPLIGGVELAFANPPKVDLDLSGLGGNIAEIPGIDGAVRKVINDLIASIIVAPNRIVVPLSAEPDIDTTRLRSPRPEGVLRISVLQAQLHDISLNMGEPYARIRVGKESQKTGVAVASGGGCYQWRDGEATRDFIVWSMEQLLQIEVATRDPLGATSPLATTLSMRVRRLVERSGSAPVVMKLEPVCGRRRGGADAQAGVVIRVEWLLLGESLSGAPAPGPHGYLLGMKIDGCSGLPDMGTPSSVSVRLSVKGDESRTRMSSPGWARAFRWDFWRQLESVRRLVDCGMDEAMIADVMGIDQALLDEVLRFDTERCASRLELLLHGGDDEEQLRRAIAVARGKRQAMRNPAFETILWLPLPSKDVTAVVEVVSKRLGRKSDAGGETGVIADFELPLGDDHIVEGPFVFEPRGNFTFFEAALLSGQFSLWRLEAASEEAVEAAKSAGRFWCTAGGGACGGPWASLNGRPRKRDQLRRTLQSTVQRLTKHGLLPESTGLLSAAAAWTAAPLVKARQPSLTAVSCAPEVLSLPRLEQAARLIREGGEQPPGSGKVAVLSGLSMLKSPDDWRECEGILRRRSGRDVSLASVAEVALGRTSRARAAQMLQFHGIGDGVWPPASRRPRLERAAKELRCARAHQVLIALGHLRDSDEFAELLGLFRRLCPDRAGGDIVALAEAELGGERLGLARCAQLLRAIGVGDGSWPPRQLSSLERFLDLGRGDSTHDVVAPVAAPTPHRDSDGDAIRRRLAAPPMHCSASDGAARGRAP